jgi:cell shape-determining protein MreC
MSYLRFNHVFFALMMLSVVFAFVIPPEKAGRLAPQIQLLFVPVSRPIGAIAAVISNRFASSESEDRRKTEDIRRENLQLRGDVASLQTQLDEMYRRNAELDKLGSVKDLCRLIKVIGSDSGTRDSLEIEGSTLQGISNDMYVLIPGSLVGQIQRAGVGGAQVRLITDPGFRRTIRFVRFTSINGKTQFERLGMPAVLAEGLGNGLMVVRGLTWAAIGCDDKGKPNGAGETLHVGTDFAELYDNDSPRRLQGQMLGRVVSIGPRNDARGYAEIRLAPNANLKKLREVMVMTKEN